MNRLELKLNNKIISAWTRDDVDQSVVAEIFKWREYRVAENIIKLAKYPIIDAGAHIGLFSLYCRALNNRATIYALEPIQENVEMLKKNILENKFNGIEIIKISLSAESGEGIIKLSPDNHNHRLLRSTENGDLTKKVDMITLSDLIAKFKIKKISLLKMDIEGEENYLLPDWDDKIFKKIGAIIMEYHNAQKDDSKKMEGILRQRGFGVRVFPSRFDNKLGFIFANNKRQKIN